MPVSTLPEADRGVSPVVGVVLLVGVTVILAATIATMVFAIGAQPTVAPQVDWRLAYDGEGTLTVTHAAGDPIDGTAVTLTGDAVEEDVTLADLGPDRWTVGSSATVTVNASSPDNELLIVWEDDGGSGALMAEWYPPDG